jgi:hypothetical protein
MSWRYKQQRTTETLNRLRVWYDSHAEISQMFYLPRCIWQIPDGAFYHKQKIRFTARFGSLMLISDMHYIRLLRKNAVDTQSIDR